MARHKAQHALSRTARAEWQAESEKVLVRCLQLDPLDARAYVALGKLYMSQQRFDEAAHLYEDGCAATGWSFPQTCSQRMELSLAIHAAWLVWNNL